MISLLLIPFTAAIVYAQTPPYLGALYLQRTSFKIATSRSVGVAIDEGVIHI